MRIAISSAGLRTIGLCLAIALGIATAPAGAAPTPPTDTHWRLGNVVGLQELDPTITDLVVDSEGNLSGIAGCNHFRRELGDDGYAATIVTRRSCSEARMRQETAFLQAIERTRDWEHDGERLLLRDAEGRTLAMMLEPITRSYHFDCEGKAVVFDVIRRGQIRLTVDDRTVLMQREESASGSRYRDKDGTITFRGRGTTGRLTRGDETRECRQVPPPDAAPGDD